MDLNNILDSDYKVRETIVCDNLLNTTLFDRNQEDMNIMHVNIRSIYQNFDQFLVFLESLEKQFDVIVMSETHNIYDTKDFNIPGYRGYRAVTALGRARGRKIGSKSENSDVFPFKTVCSQQSGSN